MSKLSHQKKDTKDVSQYWVSGLSDNEVHAIYAASQDVAHWEEILGKTSDTPITDLLRGVETLDISEIYPRDTVEDKESGSQYYFHAHDDRSDEYGHFHTYVMSDGIPLDIRAKRSAVTGDHADPSRTHCHLVAIGLDDHGIPQSLFTTNYWSSQDAEYDLADLARIMDAFDVAHAVPSYPVNRWISALLKLFRPQILDVFRARQARFAAIRESSGAGDPAKDERIEVPSETPISIPEQIAAIQAEYLRRGLG